MSNVSYSYVEPTAPVRIATVSNPKGYLDLKVAKNKNGKALRLFNGNGDRVMIATSSIPGLIEALNKVATKGVSVSVDDRDFLKAAGAL